MTLWEVSSGTSHTSLVLTSVNGTERKEARKEGMKSGRKGGRRESGSNSDHMVSILWLKKLAVSCVEREDELRWVEGKA